MKSYWKSRIITIRKANSATVVMLLAILFSACTSGKKGDDRVHGAVEYTCAMHPQVKQEKPGTCPICGMELVKKSHGGNEMVVTEGLQDLIKPTNTSVIANIKTTHAERKALTVNTVAPGIVNYDTRKTYSVPVRFGGRIEKLFLKFNYQPIKKGQVIMEVYSPELLTAQRELLYVVNEQKEDMQLLESARQKLFLLGLTSEQIEKIITAGKETFAFPVLSPYSGYIVESTISAELPPPIQPQGASLGGGGMSRGTNGGMQTAAAMNASPSASSWGQQISIREGMYVTTGQSVFKVIDDTRLWAELYFSGKGMQIRKGDTIELQVKGLNEPIFSRVDFIQPFFSEGNQFLQVRSYLNDSKSTLRVGQLVTAHVSQSSTQALWIPKKAVLDLGVQQIVFLKNSESFVPYKVKTGVASDGWIEIIEGLDETSEIAINAQYLVDSESFIKVMNQ